MPKRLCPFEENEQCIKKHLSVNSKVRGIKSQGSEKTLQLLFRGASKQLYPRHEEKFSGVGYYNCCQCSVPMNYMTKCSYCDNFICSSCINICRKCEEDFCRNCSFPNYAEPSAVCYSCY